MLSKQLEIDFPNIYEYSEQEQYQRNLVNLIEFQLKEGQVPKELININEQFILKIKIILCIPD